MTLAVTLTVDELRAIVREESAKAAKPVAAESPVLTRVQAAKLLQVHPSVVSRYVRDLGLPARHVGGEWRLLRPEVMAWVEAQKRVKGGE